MLYQDFVFYVDEQGKHQQQKNVFSIERLELIDNPIFEKVYRTYYQNRTPDVVRTGNLLVAYNSFLHKQTDLDNYLHYKPLTPMDMIRGVWYAFMTKTGFTNAYRYDHIMSRSDLLYMYDVVKVAMNINRKDFKLKAQRQLSASKILVDYLDSILPKKKVKPSAKKSLLTIPFTTAN